ncbi:sugar ABC transporter, ATP-binding protein [Oceanicola granulosus HTCC2516]|uniref:Sugar ABC transporter, ATP-binding protein n=1 Tax=Oceanicola granulosus (strain ATCC BAA-861 / DSM 15982 / KCTC 12143 / HTCC2516) TaxID=314256 RepID=Q2CGM2_OCEGH|nr:ABC transporter ATP-binding protein [Oceanicola granulosus]EAR51913.1 sugar ABC transporter, ATP-binding protein [Oceanicola granulosus HTCC2516]
MILELSDIHKSYGRHAALKGLSLSVREGSFTALLGPSSAGKTTTLRIIGGLETVDRGAFSLYGQDALDVPVQGRDLAMVFQTFALYPHLTVAENLGYPLRRAGLSRAETATRVTETAEMLRIAHRIAVKPGQLSGGERQRVAIGRALIRKPRLLLLDEPLTNLDAKLRDEMRVELKRLHRELGITMLFATPDQLEATSMAEQIALIDDGRIIARGTPDDLYEAPRSAKVARMLGSPPANVVAGAATPRGLSLGFATLADAAHPSGQYVIRPNHLRLDPAAPDFRADVVLIEALGDSTVLHLEAGDHALRCVCFGETARTVRIGDEVPLRIDRDHLRALPEP